MQIIWPRSMRAVVRSPGRFEGSSSRARSSTSLRLAGEPPTPGIAKSLESTRVTLASAAGIRRPYPMDATAAAV